MVLTGRNILKELLIHSGAGQIMIKNRPGLRHELHVKLAIVKMHNMKPGDLAPQGAVL